MIESKGKIHRSVSMSNKDKLIAIIHKSLYEMAFKDIERAVNGGSKMGAFILASCFIDAMAGYAYGQTESNDKKNSQRFKDFIEEFFPKKYSKRDMYYNLRCGLVHSYTDFQNIKNKSSKQNGSKSKYVFTDEASHIKMAGKHLTENNDRKTILVLEDFLSDVKKAFFDLLNKIKDCKNYYDNAQKRFKAMGTIFF